MLELINTYAYPISISVGFFVLYILIRLKVKGVEIRRLASIKKRFILDPVETNHPDDSKNLAQMKVKGVEGLENRFAFINKSLPVILVIIWSVLISIPYLGKIPAVYITMVAAISSVIVGVALRPFLENLFSGIVISFFRSVRIGDTVIIDNHYGLIEEIGLTYSILKRWDWYRVVIPNSQLLNKEIENLTLNDKFIWAYIEFYVEPSADITLVERFAKQAAEEAPHYKSDEPPSFWVMDMDKTAVKCWLAAWATSPMEAWELRNEMRTKLIQSLQSEKIAFNCNKISR